jgi:hypothetical protein
MEGNIFTPLTPRALGAVDNGRVSVGKVSVGMASVGMVSVGMVSVGMVSVGVVSVCEGLSTEDFFHAVAMVEIDVHDDAGHGRVVNESMGGADDDIIKVTVSAA